MARSQQQGAHRSTPTRMQTTLALAALAVVAVVALTVQRHRAGLEARRVGNEVDAVALGVATAHLNRASTLPFDAATRVLDVATLTAPLDFGGAASWAAAGDLDDVHGLTEAVGVDAVGGPLTYAVRADVRYVRLDGGGFVPAPGPTPYKELTVTVAGADDRSVTLSRVYGCRFNS